MFYVLVLVIFHLTFLNSADGVLNNYGQQNGVRCPGGKTQCPNGNTCCKTLNEDWGCCPARNAVCCHDKIHCCPEYTWCEKDGECVCFDGTRTKWLSKSRPLDSITICGDGKSSCDDGQTCCLDMSGGYSCCAMERAVCCQDLLHCCPNNTLCDPDKGRCTQPFETKAANVPLTKLQSKAKFV